MHVRNCKACFYGILLKDGNEGCVCFLIAKKDIGGGSCQANASVALAIARNPCRLVKQDTLKRADFPQTCLAGWQRRLVRDLKGHLDNWKLHVKIYKCLELPI